MKDIVAIILAGGKSDRFWPLSSKNLIDFTKGNLLEYHINSLSKLGVKDFIVVSSPEVAAFLRVNNKFFRDVNIERVLQNGNMMGIGNGVLLAFGIYSAKYKDRPVYIINCDDVYNDSLHEDIYNRFKKESPDVMVAAYKVLDNLPLGFFKIDNLRVKGIIEKPSFENRPSNLANMSLHLYKSMNIIADSIAALKDKEDITDDLYERALNNICQKYSVSKVEYYGDWEILKYPWNTLSVMDYFLKNLENKISDKAYIDKTAKITGFVIIEEGVKVFENARIVGPSVIKKNTIIGTGSMVRESIVGQNCVVGYNSEVTRSYVGDECWFHTNYVGDSVLGNRVTMGAGAVLANLRLDQKTILSKVKDTRIDSYRPKLGAIIGNFTALGVQCAVMPGIKIGRNCVVGPMVLLDIDLEDSTKIILKQKVELVTSKSVLDQSLRKQFRKSLKM